ncbi:hypothetical protein [Paracoccus sp. NSM]|uniref:hypothetical protein n=1 Tax=Paracoccus sp. NSM TaxID=3457784 RepID=UPI0040354F1D
MKPLKAEAATVAAPARRLLATADVPPTLLDALSDQGTRIETPPDLSQAADGAPVAILWDIPAASIREALAESRDPAPVARAWQIRAQALLDLHRAAPERCALIAASGLAGPDAASVIPHVSGPNGAGLARAMQEAGDPLAALLALGVLASDPDLRDTLSALDGASLGQIQPATLTSAAARYAALLDSAGCAVLMREQLLLQQLSPAEGAGASPRAATDGRMARITAELHQTLTQLRQERSRRKQAEDQRDSAVMRQTQTAETLAAVLTSRSWRITRPLRTLSMWLLRSAPPIDGGRDEPR